MPIFTTLISPFNLLFFIIIIGFSLGSIRIKGISLGIAGILFSSIFAGLLISLLLPQPQIRIISNVQETMNIFSKLGTSLFVSIIGLQTGLSIKNNSKESLLSLAIGVAMSFSGVGIMLIISLLDQTISYSTLLGILCGALTSTPGLSSVCELAGISSNEAVWGYSCSYLSGVILTVFSVQILATKTDNQDRTNSLRISPSSKIYPELTLISISSLLGNIIGNVYISEYNISIGSTLGILLVGLISGYIVQNKSYNIQISSYVLNSIKSLGLSLFFVGIGFSAGIQSAEFNVKTVIYGAIITLISICCGILICKLISSHYKLNVGFIVAGGMTSSPAYGAISHYDNDSSVNHFSFAYFGSLIALTLAVQIVSR